MISRLVRLIPRSLRRELKGRVADASREATAERAAAAESRVAELEQQLSRVRSDAADLDTTVQQVLTLLRRDARIPPPPPKHLQERVVGNYVPGFLESGWEVYRELDKALEPAGRTLKDFRRILDFGCGCGRAVRALKLEHPDAAIDGTDIDEEAIAWLAWNYAPFGRFTVAPHHPPTAYPDGSFDFIYGISVFTHLPEDLQHEWLAELRRIAAPGAHLVLTTHGQTHWSKLAPDAVREMETRGFYYSDFGFNYGRSISLPDFYQTAFHSHDYIRRVWGAYFEVVAIRELAMGQHQDTVLLRKT